MATPTPTPQPTFRIVVIGLVSLAIAMGIGRFAFTPLLPLMRDDGLVSLSGGGVLASVHFVGYLMGALCAARIPCSPRLALRLSLISVGVATLGMGATDSFAAWSVLRWLAGVCSAFTLVLVGNYYVKRLAEAGRAEMQGWVFSGVGVGIAAAGLGALVIMIDGIGGAESWRLFGFVTLAAVAAVAVAMASEIPNTRPARTQDESPRSPLAWRLIIAYGAAGMGYIIPATYLPVMARAIVQDPIVFGWSWPAFGAAAFVSTLLAARFHRRFSNRRIWAVSQIVMALGLILPVVHSHIATIVTAGVLVGGTFMIITMAGIREAHLIAPADDVMRHIAALTAAFATGQMIGPVFASTIHDLTGDFSAALVATALALAVTVLTLGSSYAKRRTVTT